MTIDYSKLNGLVPAIIQDADTRVVLMLGFMNRLTAEINNILAKGNQNV